MDFIETNKLKFEGLTEEIKQKSQSNSLKDSASVNVAAGLGDSYIGAFAIALNASAAKIGLLTSLPNLFAPLAQLLTPKLMEKMSRKKIFSAATFLQSLIWLPILAVPFIFWRDKNLAVWSLIILYTVYAACGNLAAPAWLSWIGDLLDKKKIGQFFGLRNSIGSLVAIAAVVLGGVLLEVFKTGKFFGTKTLFVGFGILFFWAACFRLLSRRYVLLQHEPKFHFSRHHYFSFWQFIKNAPRRNYGRFTIYVALIILTSNISGPFYAIYMLRDLNFSYVQFMLANVMVAVATFIFMPLWGRFSDKYGNIQTLRFGGLMIPFIAFLWPVIVLLDKPLIFPFLLVLNFFSGFAWAGFNLAAGSFIYDVTSPERRSICSAYASVLNGIGVIIGVTLGSILISRLKVSFINVVLLVSLISGVGRYIVSLTIGAKILEVRAVELKPTWRMIPLISHIFSAPFYLQGQPTAWLFRPIKNRITIKEEIFEDE